MGRVGGVSPGVTGAATERPLEGVAEDPTGAGYNIRRPLNERA